MQINLPAKTKPPRPLEGYSDPDDEFEELLKNVQAYMPTQDLKFVEKAYHYAADCHKNQKRRSGEPYITHPLAVANILTTLRLDLASIVAAVLHDTVEDTCATIENIEKEFGHQVAELVDGLTKISKIEFRSSKERLAENFRKMILAMAKDLRVILIKLADRLHNMRTISSLPTAKGERIAQETLEIYAPLSNRLGIYNVKSELEDLCLRVLKPEIYQQMKANIAIKKSQRQSYIEEVKNILSNELKKYALKNVEIYGRPKHFYSIYKKMIERQLDFEDIHDLFAFRIIVDSLKDCYEALGIVHAMWKPMPGRFKDYIAMPKANLYQSLHTTVIRPNGEPAEIQIRTKEMHKICEFGVAAHWAYKEKKDSSLPNADLQKFSWLRQIVQWQSELTDPDEFLEAVKVDLFDEEIFVFTPKGDVISLPRGSTALDFAFAVHSEIGLKTIGTKINGRMAAIKRKLESGDIVEILTSPHQNPNKDWLNFVYTSKARNKIRSALRSHERQKSKELGESMLAQALEERGTSIEKIRHTWQEEELVRIAKESRLDDLLISIGYGRINVKELIDKVFPSKDKEPADITAKDIAKTISKPKQNSSGGVLVSGLENVLVSFGRCCNPLPGEEIVGFITRGRGVTVHRANCSRALDLDPHRRIDVSWQKTEDPGFHTAYLRVLTKEKTGVLAEITRIVSECGANIQKLEARLTQDLMGVVDFELGLKGLEQLNSIIRKLEALSSVVTVERKSIMKYKSGKKA